MTKTHWLIIGGLFTAMGLQLSALKSLHDALSPSFLGGLLVSAGTVIAALFTDKVGQ